MPPDSPARLVYEASAAAFALDAAMERLAASTPLVSPADGWKVVYAAKEQRDALLPWCAQLQTDFAQLWRKPALLTAELEGIGLHTWRLMVAKAVRDREKQHWWRCVQERPTLRVYSQLKKSAAGLVQEAYLSTQHGGWNDLGLVGRRALTRIRCGHHELRACTGPWDDIDEEDRWCPLCATAVETEQHFLLDCGLLKDERATLYGAINVMLRKVSEDRGEGVTLEVQQLSRDELWTLLTGGLHGSVKPDALRRRVHALILAAIAQWTQQRKKLLAMAEKARCE